MHFITFPVATTNIFPLVNSKQGGQLATEFNLKSREMVATNSNIKYAVGPSFVHSLDDFKVTLAMDSVGAITSTSKIQVSPGRAVINGHYVETLAPMVIDMVETNINLKQNAQKALEGNLSIGIKSYFSTESTMAGAMLVENSENMYVGIQLVIMSSSEFKTPNDCPNDQSAVTADLKLADFTYINGAIPSASIVPNTNATRYIASDRIYDFDSLLDDKYVSATGLQKQQFYVYSGAASDTGKPGWCQAAENLMVWDADAEHNYAYLSPDAVAPTVGEAQFKRDTYGNVYLVVPHKQPDAVILDNVGNKFYYLDKAIAFPTASYTAGTSGIVTKDYTDRIKQIATQIQGYKEFTGGKQIGYWDTLDTDSDGNLNHKFPTNLTTYDVGDYILVREDYTLYRENSAVPSTMYVVLPGVTTSVVYSATTPTGINLGTAPIYAANYVKEDTVPEASVLGATMHLTDYYDPAKSYTDGYDLVSGNHWAVYAGKTYHCNQATTGTWDATCWTEVFDFDANTLFDLGASVGIVGTDYFCAEFHSVDESTVIERYYPINGTSSKSWSKPIVLTGGVPLATESQAGGFYNIPSDDIYADAGYVIMDETGHLRLRDYALLRQGTLAYQLGDDFAVPTNQTLEYIQQFLDNNVNERIAFVPGDTASDAPVVLTVKVPLPADVTGELHIYALDSRFGTAVRLLFTGDPDKDYSGIIINITNCEKIMIDSNVTTFQMGPMINVFNSCLYYDPEIINYIRLGDATKRSERFPEYEDFTGFNNLTLWYYRFRTNDPDLIINGMEISQPNATMTTQDIAFWSEDIPDDSHYSYALRSITLSGTGKLVACSLYVSNSTSHTAPITTTRHIIIGGDFILPQGSDLNYPQACVDNALKITGTFTTAYKYGDSSWVVTDTTFTAQSGVYDSSSGMGNGSIAFNSETYLVESTYIPADKSLDGWAPNSWHIFYGGAIIGGL